MGNDSGVSPDPGTTLTAAASPVRRGPPPRHPAEVRVGGALDHDLGPVAFDQHAEVRAARLGQAWHLAHRHIDAAVRGERDGLPGGRAVVRPEHRHRRRPGDVRGVGDEDEGLDAGADHVPGHRPAPRRHRRSGRQVALLPAALAGPPHRSLDDDADPVERFHDRRHRRIGEPRILEVDRDREPALGGDIVFLHQRRAVRQQVGDVHPRRLGRGVGDQVDMSKNPPVAPSARNQRGRGGHAAAGMAGPEDLPGFTVSMYIDRSTRIGTSDTMRAETSVAARPGRRRPAMVRRDSAATVYDTVIGGGRRRAEVGHLHVRCRRRRILQQVEQLEGAVRRALGEEPGRRRGRGRGLGVAAVAAAPGHDAVGDERLVGLDDRGERGREAAVRVDAARLARRDREGCQTRRGRCRRGSASPRSPPSCSDWRCRPGSGRRRCWRLRRGSAHGSPSGGCRAGTPRDWWRRRRRNRPPHRRRWTNQSEPRLPRARHAVAVGVAIEDVEVGQTVDVVGNHLRSSGRGRSGRQRSRCR